MGAVLTAGIRSLSQAVGYLSQMEHVLGAAPDQGVKIVMHIEGDDIRMVDLPRAPAEKDAVP
ncbi:MAG: hypothetical protein WAK82_17355 [Streptosporangiaceae bacterium]